ncbi:hypothetical protein NEMIN01_1959 [Nematocida minor]|uniref:uncharacterized protein n=1 Tax=Nematocida minor TaxID=1912983 RepID=UPI002220D8D5|nr:uncharacterized protein NEMIN01_1959 [Nematocida minor]KAI5192345.1 hypothetical protein NEMIN01_1959 [Nematocida minor]
MENQKKKKIVNAACIALIFFATQCRGSGNAGGDESLWDAIGQCIDENNLHDAIDGQPTPVNAVGAGVPGTSRSEDVVMESNDNVFFNPLYDYGVPGPSDTDGVVMMDYDDVFFDDLVTSENEYNAWNPPTTTEEFGGVYATHPQPTENFGGSRNAFDPVHTVHNQQNEGARRDDDEIIILEPGEYNTAQNRNPFAEQQRMEAQYIGQQGVGMNAFNVVNTMSGPSSSDSTNAIWVANPSESTSNRTGHWVTYRPSARGQQYIGQQGLGQQHIEQQGVSRIPSTREQSEDNFTPPVKIQRREDGIDVSNSQRIFEDNLGPYKPLTQINQSNNPVKTSRTRIEKLTIKQWNEYRLTDKKRAGPKSCHQTVYADSKKEYGGLDAFAAFKAKRDGEYQKTAREDIVKFSNLIADKIDQNPFLYFNACRSTHIGTKQKDYMWMIGLFAHNNEEDEKYRELVRGLKGYYPDAYKDLLAYIKKHRPMRATEDLLQNKRNETLGDIYMRRSLDLNSERVKHQDKISQINSKYTALAYAMRMILALPEIQEDFSQIGEDFIKATEIYIDSTRNAHAHSVLVSICVLAKEKEPTKNIQKIEKTYEDIYTAFKSIYEKGAQKELTVAKFYRGIHIILANFYVRETVFDYNKYVLLGKSAIKHQKNVKCEATLVSLPESSSKRISNPKYSSELDDPKDSSEPSDPKYSLDLKVRHISPDVEKHYHVYYVDNESHQLRKLCMPIYVDENTGEESYIHTINDITAHIIELYEIGKNSNVIYPFKVNKKTRKWSQIEEEGKSETAKELVEYELVFYRIDEDLAKVEFTFSKFIPRKENDTKNIRVPLFLMHLMQDAVHIGPFITQEELRKINLLKIKGIIAPNLYKFNEDYGTEKYSSLHKYYSNLYIPTNEEKKETFDCYVMEYKSEKEGEAIKVEWTVDMTKGVFAYTSCFLDKKFKEKENSKKLLKFINVLESREYNKDSNLQSIWLKNGNVTDSKSENQAEKIYIWEVDSKTYGKPIRSEETVRKEHEAAEKVLNIKTEECNIQESKVVAAMRSCNDDRVNEEKRKKNKKCVERRNAEKKLESLSEELKKVFSKKPDEEVQLIVFRNVNTSKSNLGAHNEILDVLITYYY